MAGQLSFSIDDQRGLIRAVGIGMWTPETTERHFQNLDTALRIMRRKHGLARTLIDLREAAVQTAETARCMKEGTARIYQPVDRAAVICSTQLLAMQIRRAAQVHQLATFTDVEAALEWLMSDAPVQDALLSARAPA